jgi:hypothetical protein
MCKLAHLLPVTGQIENTVDVDYGYTGFSTPNAPDHLIIFGEADFRRETTRATTIGDKTFRTPGPSKLYQGVQVRLIFNNHTPGARVIFSGMRCVGKEMPSMQPGGQNQRRLLWQCVNQAY